VGSSCLIKNKFCGFELCSGSVTTSFFKIPPLLVTFLVAATNFAGEDVTTADALSAWLKKLSLSLSYLDLGSKIDFTLLFPSS